MPAERSSDVKFEIGHVLFIDIVGYSKLLISEQSELQQTLKEIVRGTEQFSLAQAQGKLLALPTGDGGLVFRTSPEVPVLCALEISRALKSHPELPVRMGIHSGPVNEITDLNEQANIAGAGINMAQRVMDCGDAGHISFCPRHLLAWPATLQIILKNNAESSLFELLGDVFSKRFQSPAPFVGVVLLQEVAGLDDVFEDHPAEARRRFLERRSVEDFVV